MQAACDICGCTKTNLVDGFYYCAECGTQDTNVRETVVEMVTLGDGACAFGVKKRFRQIPQANKEQMTDDWYKWHSMNFLLHGLASELVELGAASSFKTKLLWVWTRYMKQFQNKADFGLETNEDEENADKEEKNNIEDEEDAGPSMTENFFGEENIRDFGGPKKTVKKVNIKTINMNLVISFLYVALNLDKSPIQLSHLIRFIKEGRLSVLNWRKFVPEELHPKKLYFCLLFNRNVMMNYFRTILQLAMQLFRELDLGNPIVPDLRLLVDEYIKELCLPNDMKPLVLSLMHFRSFDYLDINVKIKEYKCIPSYELYVISHILCAIKICFSVDGEYEDKISDAVDKINEIEDRPKSYNSEPTERLFSFREWLKYIQFRKSMLWTHSLYLGAPHYTDMNDYVTFEHLSEKPDYKKTLKDEITRDILNKFTDGDVNVIPKSEFPVTTTAHTTYTRVISEHQQDKTIKQLLNEDFTQYSLKYITEDMFLVDSDSANPNNILTGVSIDLKQSCSEFNQFKEYASAQFDRRMVYVRDCDNHNWLITQRPQLEHVLGTSGKENIEFDENENERGEPDEVHNILTSVSDVNGDIKDETYDSDSKETLILNGDDEQLHNSDSNETIIIEDSKILNDLNGIIEMEIDKERQSQNILNIPEEVEHENIFDDDFLDIDVKKENDDEIDDTVHEAPAAEAVELPNIRDTFFPAYDCYNQEYPTRRNSDASSEDSVHINPESLDRNKAIKELVIHACNKYKITIPGYYICRQRRKVAKRLKYDKPPRRAKVLGLTGQKIKELIAEYYNQIEHDIFQQMSNMVQSAVNDFNEANNVQTSMEVEETPNDNETIATDVQNDNEVSETETLNNTQNLEVNEIDKYKLFDEDSDGETHAEELLPKKNPNFDETTHDVSQLYIKQSDDTGAPEINLHPDLFKIIDDVLEDKSPSSPEATELLDSEDEISLSVLQELKQMSEQLSRQSQQTLEQKLTPLIKNPIPPYKYWIRHYSLVAREEKLYQHFATEIDNVFSVSFKVVIKECADVVGYPPYFLYKYLQRVETCIKDKYLRRKRLNDSYFEKSMRKFARHMY